MLLAYFWVWSDWNCLPLSLARSLSYCFYLYTYSLIRFLIASVITYLLCSFLQISSSDNLSLRICHACISYLNSWQSFKNRCLSAQTKQRSWLEGSPQKVKISSENSTTASTDNHCDDQQQKQQQQHDEQSLASSILEGISTLKKRKSLTVYVSQKQQQQLCQKETSQAKFASQAHSQSQPHASASLQMPLLSPSSKSKQPPERPAEVAATTTSSATDLTNKPLITKRRYTRHKHSQRKLDLTIPYRSQSQTASTSRCSSKNKRTKYDKKQTQQQQLQQLQSFAIPAAPGSTSVAATATITSCSVSNVSATSATCSSTNTLTTSGSDVTSITSTIGGLGLDVDCIAGTSASTSAACSSAVQQLRLFRRYSYNVKVSYTSCQGVL